MNNTGADQPAHPRSLINAFAIRFLERIICKLATGEISIFKLVSLAGDTGLSLSLSEAPKTGFLATRPIYWPAHEFSVIILYAHMPLMDAHAGISSKAGGLHYGLNLHLHPYYVYASREGCGETENTHLIEYSRD